MTVHHSQQGVSRQTFDQLVKLIRPGLRILFVADTGKPAHFTLLVPLAVFEDCEGAYCLSPGLVDNLAKGLEKAHDFVTACPAEFSIGEQLLHGCLAPKLLSGLTIVDLTVSVGMTCLHS